MWTRRAGERETGEGGRDVSFRRDLARSARRQRPLLARLGLTALPVNKDGPNALTGGDLLGPVRYCDGDGRILACLDERVRLVRRTVPHEQRRVANLMQVLGHPLSSPGAQAGTVSPVSSRGTDRERMKGRWRQKVELPTSSAPPLPASNHIRGESDVRAPSWLPCCRDRRIQFSPTRWNGQGQRSVVNRTGDRRAAKAEGGAAQVRTCSWS